METVVLLFLAFGVDPNSEPREIDGAHVFVRIEGEQKIKKFSVVLEGEIEIKVLSHLERGLSPVRLAAVDLDGRRGPLAFDDLFVGRE